MRFISTHKTSVMKYSSFNVTGHVGVTSLKAFWAKCSWAMNIWMS